MTIYRNTLDTLCYLVQTGDEADRCYAARTLGILKDNTPVSFLIERLKDEDLDVAIDAAEALGNIGAGDAVPALIESLQKDPSGELCAMIATALGKIGDERAIDPLLTIAVERPEDMEWEDDWDTWWDVQKSAIKSLGKLHADKALKNLVSLLDDESQQDIEPTILNTLIQISEEGEDAVIRRLQSQSSRTMHRRRAAHALAQSSTATATKALGRALTDTEADVRAEAAMSLAEKNSAVYISALTLLLRDPSHDVRQASLRAITSLTRNNHSAEVMDAFKDMLSDPSPEVRTTLYSILLSAVQHAPLSDQNFEAVLNCIDDSFAEAAAGACTLLGMNGNLDALLPLLQIVGDNTAHPMVRREAATAVGKLGQLTLHVLDTLETAITDREQVVRLAALVALRDLEKSNAVSPNNKSDEAVSTSPIDIIIGALRGEIQLPEPAAAPVEITLNTEIEHENPADIPVRKTTENTEGATDLNLPDTPARIVAEGDIPPAMSTLDAISMANVETMIAGTHPEKTIQDEVTLEYMDIVEDNKEIMQRMRSHKKIDAQQDIRRLAAHILADFNTDRAIETLIQALNDDAPIVRREAAESIGIIANSNPHIPILSDAVGILITQMAVADLDQKIASARALSRIGNRTALIPLTEALKDPAFTLRVQAIESLARLCNHGHDPVESDHMVIRDMPPLSIARKLTDCLKDKEMAVRVAATKALGEILPPLKETLFTHRAVEQIIQSINLGTGEEARLVGKALRKFDTDLANELLLDNLKIADDSIKRSVFIEMIEELLSSRDKPGQAA
jgi:HEAT repeat protein